MSDQEQWVLQFCHSYYGPFADCARQYAALFKGSNFRVTTVYLSGEPNADVEQTSASDEVIFLGYESKDIRGLKLRAIRDLRKLARQRDYAFCIAHRFKPIYIALLATRLPVIGIHHSFRLYSSWNRRFVVNLFKRRLLLLAVSDAVRDEIRSDLKGWPENKIQRLYNRIDLDTVIAEQLSRDEARLALNLSENAWVLGSVGRLHPDKDPKTLIKGFAEALPQLPHNSVLCIVGDGSLSADLKDLVRELGLKERVHFTGQVPYARRYFKAFDAFALSSGGEPFGMVLLEAMAAGVPLVCSDGGGPREIVSGLGALFPVGDVQSLARALVEIVDLPEEELLGQREAMLQRLRIFYDDKAVQPLFFDLLRSSELHEKVTGI